MWYDESMKTAQLYSLKSTPGNQANAQPAQFVLENDSYDEVVGFIVSCDAAELVICTFDPYPATPEMTVLAENGVHWPNLLCDALRQNTDMIHEWAEAMEIHPAALVDLLKK